MPNQKAVIDEAMPMCPLFLTYLERGPTDTGSGGKMMADGFVRWIPDSGYVSPHNFESPRPDAFEPELIPVLCMTIGLSELSELSTIVETRERYAPSA